MLRYDSWRNYNCIKHNVRWKIIATDLLLLSSDRRWLANCESLVYPHFILAETHDEYKILSRDILRCPLCQTWLHRFCEAYIRLRPLPSRKPPWPDISTHEQAAESSRKQRNWDKKKKTEIHYRLSLQQRTRFFSWFVHGWFRCDTI